MKACPTKAIRLRGRPGEKRIAVLEGECIDCGECVRVCPRDAVRSVTTDNVIEDGSRTIVSASTVIYAQFQEGVMPNDVLLGLRKMGFRYVHDQSYTSEMFSQALELYIKEHREKQDVSFPLISTICPVVVRLIACRFPSLLKNLPRLATPREIVAREAKKRLAEKKNIRSEDMKVLHITPCPAKLMSIKDPILQSHSYLDQAVGISHIYETLKKSIKEVDEDMVLHHSGGLGLGWGMSGGEIAGLEKDCLAVSGIQESIRYLEKIEMGLLQDIDYIEIRTCTGGCLGGPYTVVDKYLAEHNLRKMIGNYGLEKRVKSDYVKKLYEAGWFFTDKWIDHEEDQTLPSAIAEGIEKANSVEELLRQLPQSECGMCGSPNCRTFAEDVIDGRMPLENCLYLNQKSSKVEVSVEGKRS
jgi:Fe-S-cluster-containing hydrogenase component 2